MATFDLPRPVPSHPPTSHKRRLRPTHLLYVLLTVLLVLFLRGLSTVFLPPVLHPYSPLLADDPIRTVPLPYEAPELPPPPRPLTQLGAEADSAFHIIHPTSYAAHLATFVQRAFPPHLHPALLAGIHTLPSSSLPPPIPKRIFQTHKSQDTAPLDTTRTWWESNPESEGWNRTFLSDEGAEEYVAQMLGDEPSEIKWVWETLPRGVLRSDMLRYLVLLLEGGVYSDTDTVCLKPITRWGRGAEVWLPESSSSSPSSSLEEEGTPDGRGIWRNLSPEDAALEHEEIEARSSPRGVIVGIEADVGSRPDWNTWWPRPLQIVQWTLAAPAFHPIMLDALRRVHAATSLAAEWAGMMNLTRPQGPDGSGKEWGVADAREEVGGPLSVMEWTGPGVFTDSVLSYLTRSSSPSCLFPSLPPPLPLSASDTDTDRPSALGKWWPFGTSKSEALKNAQQGDPCAQAAAEGEEGFTWPLLRGLSRPVRVADVTVLPVTGFAPGTGMFGAGTIMDPQAMVEHRFAGSWKHPTRT